MKRLLIIISLVIGSSLFSENYAKAYELQYCLHSSSEWSTVHFRKRVVDYLKACPIIDKRDNSALYSEILRHTRRWNRDGDVKLINTDTLKRLVAQYSVKKKDTTKDEEYLKAQKKKIIEDQKRIKDEQKKIEEEKKRITDAKKNKKNTDQKLYIIGSGTGFFVSSRGHAVSNDHVVGICKKVAAKIKGKTIYFDVLSTDKKNDLGLIKGEYVSKDYLSIKNSGAEYGEDVVAFGYPLSDALSESVKVTRGIVSSLSGPGNNYSEIQIDAAIQPGNSGGPIMNMEGQVVGVASSGLNKLFMLEQAEYIPENVNFAVAAPTLTNFLKVNGVIIKNRSYRIKNTKELAKVGRPATLHLFCMNTKAAFEKLKKQQKHSDVLLEKVVELK